MTSYELENAAYNMYDGGWRAEDREDMIREYELTDDEADMICEKLAELEAKEAALDTIAGETGRDREELRQEYMDGSPYSDFKITLSRGHKLLYYYGADDTMCFDLSDKARRLTKEEAER